MFITVCLIPYNNPLLKDPTWGTYSVTLTTLGIPEARHIVNFVVLTSVCSCFNSALYTCSRMMYSLSKRGDAPKSFASTNRNNSPWIGVIFSSIFSIIAAYLTATESMNIYDVLMLATGTVSLYVYLVIAISQLKLRKNLKQKVKKFPSKCGCFLG